MTEISTASEEVEPPRSGGNSKPLVGCIGASAGGLEALERFFQHVPAQSGIAWVVVVHLSPHFKSVMPELLGRIASLPVRHATHEAHLHADTVYIIPPSQNLVVANGRLHLKTQDRTPGHGLHFPIDICMGSVAKEMGPRALGIILSGTGSDGSRGARQIKEHGGVVFVQSPHEARFDGMPQSAMQTGVVDLVANAAEIALRSVHLAKDPNALLLQPEAEDDAGVASSDRLLTSNEQVFEVLRLLDEQGFDLSYMRDATIHRRVKRRAMLQGIATPEKYLDLLRTRRGEVETLAHDLLVGVTSFFRDSSVFELLRSRVLPELLSSLPSGQTFRVWVAGCSTGQEVYSLAMCLLEAIDKLEEPRELRIFATDLNQEALRHAARGEYVLGELHDVPRALGARFLEHKGGTVWVGSALRRSVIFAPHNLVKDPPFTKIDLVSCRNVLIYLEPSYRRRVLDALTAALKLNTGVLVLGRSETPNHQSTLLDEIDASERIYRRTDQIVAIPPMETQVDPTRVSYDNTPVLRPLAEQRASDEMKVLRGVLERHFERERSSAVLIDRNNRVLEVLTDPLGLFKLRKGKVSDDLSLILPGPFAAALLSARTKLGTSEGPVKLGVIGSDPVEPFHELALEQVSVRGLGTRHYLATIQEHAADETVAAKFEVQGGASEQVGELLSELAKTKERLQSTIEELQSSNEEQQSTNEELIASNEELQSTNEELQSLNEELHTVNLEYQRKNEELNTANADLDNLLKHLTVATLYLDRELLIRKFNPPIARLIALKPSDLGRHIRDFAPAANVDLSAVAQDVLLGGEPYECQVQDREQRWLQLRADPYIGPEGEHDGVLFICVDVSQLKDAEEQARATSNELSSTNKRLEDRSNQLEELFSMLAHDLRRPLLAVDGMVTLALEAHARGEPGTAYLHRAQARLDGLRSVLVALSNFVHLNHNQPAAEQVELGTWLHDVLEPFSEQIAGSKVTMSVRAMPGSARFSSSIAKMAVRNLVENALVHGSGHPEPKIEITIFEDGAQVVVAVEDNGKGIPPEHHQRVFELFRRLDPENAPGTGVGLAAVKRLMMRVSGEVRIESEPGKGCKMEVRLPKLMQPEKLPPLPTLKAMLISEDEQVLALVRSVLPSAEPMKEPKAYTSIDDPPDLVLLDPGLPEGKGLRNLGPIRDHKLPLILIGSGLEKLERSELEEFNVQGIVDSKREEAEAELEMAVRAVLRTTQ